MRKNLFAAAMLLVGCSDGADVVAADSLDLIHVDAVESVRIDVLTGAIHLTVSNDGEQTTIAFTQEAAWQVQEGLRSMLLATEQTVSR